MDGQGTPDEFSETWPKSGLMLGGIVYPRHQRALHINDSAGGSSGWPTPTSSDHKAVSPYGQVSLGNHPDIFGTTDRPKGQKSRAGDGLRTTNPGTKDRAVLNPDWVEWLMGLPQNWVTLEPVSEESFAEWETRMADGSWWEDEHDLPRTVPSRKGRVDMLKALGNGIVPRTIPTFLNYARSN